MEEINLLRQVVTVVSFLAFGGIVAYAYAPRNRGGFDEAGRVPIDDDRPFGHGEEGR